MDYPSDSTISAQPVGDQSGQGSSYAAFHDQVYSLPGAGTASDGTMYANQSFAPELSTPGVLPTYEDLPTDAGAIQPGAAQPDAGMPADLGTVQPGAGMPADLGTVQPDGSLPSELTPAQTGINPWDTYVMDSAAITGQPDGTQLEGGSPEAALPAGSPEAQIPQIEQDLQTAIDAVVQLGTSGQLTGTQEELEQFSAALTAVVQNAEALGALTGSGGDEMPTDGSAMPTDGSAMPTDGSAMPTDGSAMPTDGSAMPTDGSAMPTDGSAMSTDGSAMPTDGSAMPTDGSAMPTDGSAIAGPIQENPYELQGTTASPEGADPQLALPTTGMPEVDMLQSKLGSQIEQLMSFISAPGADPASPIASSQGSGNADNFKMALKNIVQTAKEIGATSQSAQVEQPTNVG